MTIQWLGETGFKITGRNDQKEEIVILFDPPTNKINPKTDIVCFTSPENIREITPSSLLVGGPGEYEKKGAFIWGFPSSNKTFYSLELEEIKLLHLGKINKPLEEKFLDALGEIDIMLISLNPEAQHLINQIEPKIFIPMNFTKLDEKLAKNLSLKADQALEKLTIKKRDLIDEETKGILLKF